MHDCIEEPTCCCRASSVAHACAERINSGILANMWAALRARIRVIAVGLAVAALATAAIAVVVVARRDAPAASTTQDRPAVAFEDQLVEAADVVKLKPPAIEIVVESGRTRGVRVKAPLAKALGLRPGDIVTSFSGRPLTGDTDVYTMVANASLVGPTVLYMEVLRYERPVVIRWQLSGDLRKALTSDQANRPTSMHLTLPAPTAVDPIDVGIVKVGPLHYRIPRAIADQIVVDPSRTSGFRAVSAVDNGQSVGFTIYVIRPGSLYQQLGFENGDVVRSVNGMPLTSADAAASAYARVKSANQVSFEIDRRGRAIVLTVDVR